MDEIIRLFPQSQDYKSLITHDHNRQMIKWKDIKVKGIKIENSKCKKHENKV